MKNYKHVFTNLLTSLFFCLLVGCTTASGPAFKSLQKEDSNSAVVYVYRLYTFANSGAPLVPKLYINDELIGKMRVGGYFPLELEEGTYKFSIIPTGALPFEKKQFTRELKLEIKSGDVKYLKFELLPNLPDLTDGSTRAFKEVNPQIGKVEILETKLIGNL